LYITYVMMLLPAVSLTQQGRWDEGKGKGGVYSFIIFGGCNLVGPLQRLERWSLYACSTFSFSLSLPSVHVRPVNSEVKRAI